MNLKAIIFTALITMSCTFIYSEDTAENSTSSSSSFNFKAFKDEDECLRFIKLIRQSRCPAKHTVALLAFVNNRLASTSCSCGCIKNYKQKCEEAIEYVKSCEPNSAVKDKELIQASSFILGLTLNPLKALDPEGFKKESTLNADVAVYLLDQGANPHKKGIRQNVTLEELKQAKHFFSPDVRDVEEDDEEYVTFEEFVDALYEGSDKLPQVKSRNCASWNPFCKDPECKDIQKVRSKIKELKKSKDLE